MNSQASSRLPRTVLILSCASLLNDIASEMAYPLLPTFLLLVLHGNEAHLGLIEGVGESTASLLKLWSGGRSDRAQGRKRFLMAGYGLDVLARALFGMAQSPWQLFGLRAADRVGKGVRTTPRDALIAEVTDETNRGRAFGFHRAMDHLGAVIGPLLASAFLLLWPDQLRGLFFWGILPGLGVLLVIGIGIRDSRAPVPLVPAPQAWSWKPPGDRFRLYLSALAIFSLGNSSDAFLLWRSRELGVSDTWLPIMWAAFHVIKSVGNFYAGRASDRVGARRMILAGWLVYAVIYLLFIIASSAWHAWALFLGYGLFYALTEPAEKSLVVQLVGAEGKGLAFGWFHLVTGMAALPASLMFGVLYKQFGPAAAFGTGAVLAGFATIFLVMATQTRTGRLPSNLSS